MSDKVDIAALAKLARLEISADELAKLATGKEEKSPEHRNVMRADENPHESGKYTKALLDAAPAREGDRIAVKQVISRKKK